jgi:tetratricopeptide (TPR) repeat protein/thiol-disulfide isomerase/thioredoxin
VAQSPQQSGDIAAGSDYLKSWDALGALIARGKSFSGRERDCAFLNLGAKSKIPSFACASGAISLDQTDDSRAIIPVDWDGDGDLDLWYANRTAPRLRFFRNDVVSGSGWFALDLEGRSCNRDAIGARAELTLTTPDGTRRTLWRRLRAGDAFLSQTPRTLHFGFRPDEKIERLLIRWPSPGIKEQVIAGVQANRRCKVIEGMEALSMTMAPQAPVASGSAALPPETEPARIVLVNRLAVPKLEYIDFQARAQSIGGGSLPQPTLILLWGSWCPRCRQEMNELAAHAAALNAANVRVIALSVDAASSDSGNGGVTAAKHAIADMKWPFDAGVTSAAGVRALALLETRAIYPERPLPLPTSYLLDPSGRMSVIYHGPVTPAQIAQDAALAAQPPKDLEAAAFPFPGRSAKPLFPLHPSAHAQTLREAGYLDDARNELRRQLEKPPGQDAAGLAATWWRLADLEEESGRTAESIAAYQNALALAPEQAPLRLAFAATLWKANRHDDAQAAIDKAKTLTKDTPAFRNQLGKVWQTLGEHAKARDAFGAAATAAPEDVEMLFNLAVSRQFGGDIAGSINAYEAVLQRKPGLLDAASNLAWVLATAKDEKLRQPARALTLAEEVNTAAGGRSPAVLDNLAAAQAANGNFADAVATAQNALTLAVASGETAAAADIRKHLASYQEDRPWIE